MSSKELSLSTGQNERAVKLLGCPSTLGVLRGISTSVSCEKKGCFSNSSAEGRFSYR